METLFFILLRWTLKYITMNNSPICLATFTFAIAMETIFPCSLRVLLDFKSMTLMFETYAALLACSVCVYVCFLKMVYLYNYCYFKIMLYQQVLPKI